MKGYTSMIDGHIDEAPEKVEERHGEAIYKEHDEWWGAVFKCSLCYGEWMLGAQKKAICCPYCGAKMDGERKEQK